MRDVGQTEGLRREAYRWCRDELPADLIDHVGHPCMWAVRAAFELAEDGIRPTLPAVLARRDELMPDVYRLAFEEYRALRRPLRLATRDAG